METISNNKEDVMKLASFWGRRRFEAKILLLAGIPFSAFANGYEGSLLMAGRVNPLGLSLEGSGGYKFGLYSSSNVLLAQNFIRPEVKVTISPARLHGGPQVTFQPLSVLGFQGSMQLIRYFGTFGHVQSFVGPNEDWGDSALKDRKNNKEASGNFKKASVYLQGKGSGIAGGSFVFKAEYGLFQSSLNLPEGREYYYEPGEDLLLRNGGMSHFANMDILTDVSAESDLRYGIGLRHFNARVKNTKTNKSSSTFRAGPTFLYQLDDSRLLILLVQWHVLHPYRSKGSMAYVPNTTLAYNVDF
jgi:hypothetical protein